MFKVDVILPAAGSSERMRLPVAKQFLKVLGKHIIAYTIDSFHRLSWVRHIVVAVNADQIEFTKSLMDNYGFTRVIVCAGNNTRHRSIYCGVKALRTECSDSDVVIIHDAARPFVPEDVAFQVAKAAEVHGAAGVTRPLVSTVIQGDTDNRLTESLDRGLYRNSEMPQAFQYGVITTAYEKCTQEDFDFGTECLLLAMKYSGCHAFLVEGTDDLWKVTYQKDLYSMESVVKEKLTVVSIIHLCDQEFPAVKELQNRLHLGQLKIATTEDEAANTFVIIFDTQPSASILDELVAKIRQSYSNLPCSAVGLDLMLMVMLVQESQPQAKNFETSVDNVDMNNLNSSRSQQFSHPTRHDNCIPTFDTGQQLNFDGCANTHTCKSSVISNFCNASDFTNTSMSNHESCEVNSPLKSKASSVGSGDKLHEMIATVHTGMDLTIESNNLLTVKESETLPTVESQFCTPNIPDVHLISNTHQVQDMEPRSKLPTSKTSSKLPSATQSDSVLNSTESAYNTSTELCTESACESHGLPLANQTFPKLKSHPEMKAKKDSGCGRKVDYQDEIQREGWVCLERCTALVQRMMARLLKGSKKYNYNVSVVGVSCERQASVGEKLAELIWHRSSSLDGQSLML